MVDRRRGGFTLMEMIMVMGIISVMFAIAAPILTNASRQFILTRTKMELQQEARAIMYIITRSLRQASAETIELSRVDSSQPFYSKIRYTTLHSTSAYVSNSFTFQQEGKVLYQVIVVNGVTNKKVLTRNLDYLAFIFPRTDDMGIISVSLTLKKNIYEGQTKALHMASEKVMVMN